MTDGQWEPDGVDFAVFAYLDSAEVSFAYWSVSSAHARGLAGVLLEAADCADPESPSNVARGAEAISDLLTMLGVDPGERPEHGGPTTAETLAAAVLKAVSS
jgi:hypothetical protein